MKWIMALAAALVAASTFAQQPAGDPAAELRAAVAAAKSVMQKGPADIGLVGQATLHLPAGHAFIPKNEAIAVLRAMGNKPSPETLGMVIPPDAGDAFFVARYVPSGYIKDDDARDWNVDELFATIRKGTEEANAERRKRGIPEVEVVKWIERPAYDASSHRLVWSMSSRQRGAPADEEPGVNYNTYLLGREGYISMNLVTGLDSVEGQKPMARQLLAALEFDRGKAYGDFNAATDRVAEYGLAALIGGVAAKKLGLFALIAAFAAKFAKLIALGALALGAGLVKFFRGREST